MAFVYGQKAYDYIIETTIDNSIKEELKAARKYAEGRGISILVSENSLADIKELVKIKLMF